MADIRLLLRTKISGGMNINDTTNREVVFGDTEKSLFVKDYEGNLYTYAPLNDATFGGLVLWSSSKVQSYVYNQLTSLPPETIYYASGNDVQKRGLEIDTNGQARWQVRAYGAETSGNVGSDFQLIGYKNNDTSEYPVLDISRDTTNSCNLYRPLAVTGGLSVSSDTSISGKIFAGSSLLQLTDSSGFVDYTKLQSQSASANDVLSYNGTSWTNRSYNTKSFLLTASGGTPTLTNGCLYPATVETTNYYVDYNVLDFQSGNNGNAVWLFPLPSDCTSSTLTFTISWMATSNSGNINWKFSARAFQTGESFDQNLDSTPTSITVGAPGTINTLAITSSNTVTITGNPAAGNYCIFKLQRNVSGVVNNMVGTARVLSVKLEYTPKLLL